MTTVSMADTPSSRYPAAANGSFVARVLLGLFILWQIVFLLVANFLGLVPRTQPEEGELIDARAIPAIPAHNEPVRETISAVTDVTDYWIGLTGQSQVWWLFAPNPPRQATFVVVDLIWDDASGAPPKTVRIPSPFEPVDPQRYLRWPGPDDRLYHYDARFALMYANWTEESFTNEPELWRQALAGRVRRQWKSLRAYLLWHARNYLLAHPSEKPPSAGVVSIRVYQKPLPGQSPLSWRGPAELPFARWRMEAPVPTGALPIEAYDPSRRSFAWVSLNQ